MENFENLREEVNTVKIFENADIRVFLIFK
jgi:hypothetical protein